MNHPTHEELLEFLDEELSIERQIEVAGHVHACDECRGKMASWRGAQMALASWELPAQSQPVRRAPRLAMPRGRWRRAAAAAALVAAGFGLALLAAPRWDSARDSADLASEIRRQVQQELRTELAKFAANEQSQHDQLLTAMNGRLDQLEMQWLVDYAELRRDVETLAIGTQEGLRRLAGDASMAEDSL
jgi:hypothetical protein